MKIHKETNNTFNSVLMPKAQRSGGWQTTREGSDVT